MSEELKEILIRLNAYRDLMKHEGMCLTEDDIETYGTKVVNEIDLLINDIANGAVNKTEEALNLVSINKQRELLIAYENSKESKLIAPPEVRVEAYIKNSN